VLALKDADCGIAMASGSEATRAVAQIVLLDSSFAGLPAVVDEGRRVLAPGGRLVGSVPNAFRLKSRLRFAVGRHPETDPTHLQLFTPAALRAVLAGFDSVELRFAVGRYVRLQPRLMARSMIFAARTAAASSP